jgi:hypothetical protein
MNTCSACGEKLPAGATKCPLCLVPVQPEEEEIYNLEASAETIPAEWEGGAVYTLEFPARCPHCRELVRSLRVLRLKRSQVSFTSPLPRGGPRDRLLGLSGDHLGGRVDVVVGPRPSVHGLRPTGSGLWSLVLPVRALCDICQRGIELAAADTSRPPVDSARPLRLSRASRKWLSHADSFPALGEDSGRPTRWESKA